ncbi:MAG TPA: hypothetical protein VHB48_03140 [Chitinophagaceae bacterium]|nr:hypothetical protein [Chitinophagaceae bacterium]
MPKNYLFVLLCALPFFAAAQQGEKSMHLYNITQFGWLMGDNAHTTSIETVTGLSYKRYKAGLGVALDNYGYKSLPVFVDLRYNLSKNTKNILQFYGNGGMNIPLQSGNLPYKYNNGDVWHALHPSFYGEAGVNYVLRLGKLLSVNAGLGYNYKTFKYTEYNYQGDIVLMRTATSYAYHYSKYVLRVGFGLW